MSQDMDAQCDGIEYELTDFLLMATQDELNAANAIQAELIEHKRFMNMFDDTHSNSPDMSADDDVAGDAIDAALSASSFVASWINKPVNRCKNGEYGRTITPHENTDAAEHAKLEQQLQDIEGVLSWRDGITDQIIVGLGLRQQGDRNEEKIDDNGAAVFGLSTPFTESSKSASDASENAKIEGNVAPPNSPTESSGALLEGQSATSGQSKDDADVKPNAEVHNLSSDVNKGPKECRTSRDGFKRSAGSNNDVVLELVAKCLQTNKSNPNTPKASAPVSPSIDTPKAIDLSVDDRDDSSIPREIPVGIDCSDRSVGSKSDVIKKLAAKCLAMNKKEKLQRMPLEPDVQPIAMPSPIGPPHPETPLFGQIAQPVFFNFSSVDNEVRDPPIGPNVCRDPPEIKPQCPFQAPPMRPPAMHMKQSNTNTAMGVEDLPHLVEEVNSSRLNIESTGRTPSYYSQPPRPETPFHAGGDISRCTKILTKRAPSSFHKANTEREPEHYKSTPFKESILSSSALLRRRHYKEMLMKERAAKIAATE